MSNQRKIVKLDEVRQARALSDTFLRVIIPETAWRYVLQSGADIGGPGSKLEADIISIFSSLKFVEKGRAWKGPRNPKLWQRIQAKLLGKQLLHLTFGGFEIYYSLDTRKRVVMILFIVPTDPPEGGGSSAHGGPLPLTPLEDARGTLRLPKSGAARAFVRFEIFLGGTEAARARITAAVCAHALNALLVSSGIFTLLLAGLHFFADRRDESLPTIGDQLARKIESARKHLLGPDLHELEPVTERWRAGNSARLQRLHALTLLLAPHSDDRLDVRPFTRVGYDSWLGTWDGQARRRFYVLGSARPHASFDLLPRDLFEATHSSSIFWLGAGAYSFGYDVTDLTPGSSTWVTDVGVTNSTNALLGIASDSDNYVYDTDYTYDAFPPLKAWWQPVDVNDDGSLAGGLWPYGVRLGYTFRADVGVPSPPRPLNTSVWNKAVTLQRGFWYAAINPGVGRRLSGRIGGSSLYVAATSAGVPTDVAARMVQLFAHRIDIAHGLTPEDKFDVFYTVHSADGTKQLDYAALHLAAGRVISLYRFQPDADQPAGYFDAEGRSVERVLMATPFTVAGATAHQGSTRVASDAPLGTDLVLNGETPVVAAGTGFVVGDGDGDGHGGRHFLKVTVGDGVDFHYGNLLRLAPDVRVGGTVRQGDVVGYVGLHAGLDYKAVVNGVTVNPAGAEITPLRVLVGDDLRAFFVTRQQIDYQVAATPVVQVKLNDADHLLDPL